MNTTSKNKKIRKKGFLLVAGAALLVIFASVAIVWNKPHATVDNKKGIAIEARKLSQMFTEEEQHADSLYLNKVLSVNGVISEVTQNQDKQTVVLLEGNDPLSGVQCTMKEPVTLKPGDTATIKGFCHGYTVVVLLSGCVVEQ